MRAPAVATAEGGRTCGELGRGTLYFGQGSGMQPSPIPSELGSFFTARGALDAGVPASRLRARDLQRPFRGVRVRPPTREELQKEDGRGSDVVKEHAIVTLARQYALRMTEHEFFSHLTAAVIWGLPLPPALENTSELHVSVFAPLHVPRSRGVHGHQARVESTTARRHPKTGLRVSSPGSTWAAVAPMLEHPYDVVALADAIVRVPRAPGGFARSMPRPLGTMAELDACIRAGRRVGISALRAALPLVRLGVSSRTVATMAAERPAFVASLGALGVEGVVPAAGGVLVADGESQVIGAVGVTGDTSDNDEICAIEGIKAAGLAVLSR